MEEEFKNWVLDFLNKYVNVPYLDEKQEEILLKALLEFLFSVEPPKDEEEKILQDNFKSWVVKFLNKYVDIPVLTEEQEAVFIEAIVEFLLNIHPRK